MTQYGFAPILVLITFTVLSLVGVGIYVQSKQSFSESKNSPVEPTATPLSPLPSPSVKPKTNAIPINVTTTVSTTKPVSSPGVPAVATTAPEIIINASGTYTYSNQEIKYSISFPKNGGNVTGNVSGVCTGPITGGFSGGDGGVINSKVEAECQIGIFKQDLDADFEGKVFFSQGRADLEWKGEIPFYSGTKTFTLSFNPL